MSLHHQEQSPIRIPPGPFTFHVAMAVSPFNKIITQLPNGIYQIVDDLGLGEYDLIIIDKDFNESTTYTDMKAAMFWKMLAFDAITNSSKVWYPLAAPDPFPIFIGQLDYTIDDPPTPPIAIKQPPVVPAEEGQASAPGHPNQAWYDHMGIENPHGQRKPT